MWVLREYCFFIVPLVIALATIAFRLVARRDNDPAPIRNEFYVGLQLLLAGLGAAFTYLIKAQLADPFLLETSLACTFIVMWFNLIVPTMTVVDKKFAGEATEK